MSTFKERVLSLWPGLTVSKIAETIGVSHMGLSKIFKNGHIPKAETLLSIHEHSGCDLKWLMTGQGAPYLDPDHPDNAGAFAVQTGSDGITDTLGNPVDLSEFVFIPRYDIYAAAGHGYPVGGEKTLFCMAFRRYWVENYVSRQIDKLSVIAVKGDSMEGVLNHGDNILVNHAETDPRDGLYVIRIDNDLFVKQVQKFPGRLLIKSANPAYEPFEIDLNSDHQNLSIIGRVEWYGRAVN